jgi:hypothetical protein
MAKFDYDDMVRVAASADKKYRPGEIASVIGVFETRPAGSHFSQFSKGTVYTIEYEDGDALDIHEQDLESVVSN